MSIEYSKSFPSFFSGNYFFVVVVFAVVFVVVVVAFIVVSICSSESFRGCRRVRQFRFGLLFAQRVFRGWAVRPQEFHPPDNRKPLMTNRKKEARLNFGYPFILLRLHVPIAQINPLQGLFRPPIGPISATRPQSQKYGFVKKRKS